MQELGDLNARNKESEDWNARRKYLRDLIINKVVCMVHPCHEASSRQRQGYDTFKQDMQPHHNLDPPRAPMLHSAYSHP